MACLTNACAAELAGSGLWSQRCAKARNEQDRIETILNALTQRERQRDETGTPSRTGADRARLTTYENPKVDQGLLQCWIALGGRYRHASVDHRSVDRPPI